MKDWRGTEVEPGDVVIYCTRSGSSMTLVEGNVLKVEGNRAVVEVTNDSWYSFHPRKRPAIVGSRYLTVFSKSGLKVPDSA